MVPSTTSGCRNSTLKNKLVQNIIHCKSELIKIISNALHQVKLYNVKIIELDGVKDGVTDGVTDGVMDGNY